MRLDTAAMIALNIFPDQRQRPDFSKLRSFGFKSLDVNHFVCLGANAKSSSLFGLLNNCRTAQGQRLLMQWLKQPLTDMAKISTSFLLLLPLFKETSFCLDERLDIVDAFVNDSGIRTYISQDFLGRVPDFERLVRKFIRKKANLEVNPSNFRLFRSIFSFELGLL